ncbi:MAG: phosphate regulon sensor histidine kinase PhoR [Pseudomonadota bacterium]
MLFKYIVTELKVIIASLLLAFLLGLITGYWALSITIVLLLILGWFLSQLARLRKWLEDDAKIESTPSLYGASDQIVSRVCAIKKENTFQQQNLEELIHRFEAATAAMPDAMLIVNSQQSIEWANSAAQKILGINQEKDIGQRVGYIIRDPLISDYLSGTDYSQPLEFSSSQSEQNDLVLRVIPYGEGHRLLCVHDHRDLLRLQQMRKSFISNASHEMRTPLTVIIGYLEALTLREEPDNATRKGIEGALEQAHRLKQLIEDLLSLSRLESLPLSKSQIENVNIETLVREGIELVKASSLYESHEFEVKIDASALISGDARELKSAIQNVIENAVKYSPINTLVSIILNKTDTSGPVLRIKDQGEGVEPSQIRRLTERFYRVDKGRSRDMGGTGLGLSIVKHVMERHGGQLLIQSEIGEGTTVELHFPDSV